MCCYKRINDNNDDDDNDDNRNNDNSNNYNYNYKAMKRRQEEPAALCLVYQLTLNCCHRDSFTSREGGHVYIVTGASHVRVVTCTS